MQKRDMLILMKQMKQQTIAESQQRTSSSQTPIRQTQHKRKSKKVWNDSSNKDGIRPKSVKVNLLADGKVEETLTLSAENRWQASSKILPVKVDGKKVNYTWEEVKEGTDHRRI